MSASASTRVDEADPPGSGAPRSRDATSSLPSSTTRNLTLLEPALTTRMRTGSEASAGPGPVAYLGHIVAGTARVGASLEPLVDHLLTYGRDASAEARKAVDHVHH